MPVYCCCCCCNWHMLLLLSSGLHLAFNVLLLLYLLPFRPCWSLLLIRWTFHTTPMRQRAS